MRIEVKLRQKDLAAFPDLNREIVNVMGKSIREASGDQIKLLYVGYEELHETDEVLFWAESREDETGG